MAVAVAVDPVVAGAAVFKTALRAIGRGFGVGIFGLAGSVSAIADSVKPAARAAARTVNMAVDRSRGALAKADTAFLRGESLKSLKG
jgi:hypothetical protein